LLLLLLLIFFRKPLIEGGRYAPTDLLQGAPLLRVAPDSYVRSNVVLGDPVNQVHPWMKWNRERMGAGALPLWNPYNGWGTPHLANFQSAPFSPFTLPFLLLPFEIALVLAPFLKLFTLGLFTLLFLRRTGLDLLPALAGTVLFTFGGYQVVWLAYAHVGAVRANSQDSQRGCRK
jgi:hypothetical protein